MKTYLKTGLFATALLLNLSTPTFAVESEHKCDCTKECKENCKKGQAKDCKCKHCDCKKGGEEGSECGDTCNKKK